MRKRAGMSLRLRFSILARDEFTCQYCGRGVADVRLAVDHIIPVSKGGKDAAANLVAACEECNSGKADRVLSDDLLEKLREQTAKELPWYNGKPPVVKKKKKRRAIPWGYMQGGPGGW